MDKPERQRLKQLTVDMIVKSPVHSTEAKLAEALERVLKELDRLDQSPHCATCNCRPVVIDDPSKL